MARKKPSRSGRSPAPFGPDLSAAGAAPGLASAGPIERPLRSARAVPPTSPAALPAEATGAGVAALLALMMLLAPALGVPHEEMLQDTLKSIIVAFAALAASLLIAWQQRQRAALRWHAVIWLPLGLMAYALGSMVWSHSYLAGVEAVRWFLFSLLAWLGLNALSRERLPMLAWGIHGGAVVAALWAALQFLVDFRFFPQGPNPASTFVNRNFFAEFAVCTLPFSALLLARSRQSAPIALLAASCGLVITAILMTGTRAALLALWLQLLVVLPLIGWRFRHHLAFARWSNASRVLALGVLLATISGLGSIPTGNAKIAQEERGLNALERAVNRTGSISVNDPSLGVRLVMWKATASMIGRRPLTGVGAGAWESDLPLYQAQGSQLETDYYVHNEFLQLLAEYGLAGWLFLLLLAAWLVAAAWRTWRAVTPQAQAEAPFRAVALCSLLALSVVSNVGFPWRMASSGALFALCLALLAASDARLGVASRWAAQPLRWSPGRSRALLVLLGAGLALAGYITQQAVEAEQKIVRATKLALTISASGEYQAARWEQSKAQLLRLIGEGIAINPHYRKITPMVADELAKWGDWKNATWIWESVLSSRPYIVAILTNAARGHASTGNPAKALEYLERARQIQPGAPAVRSLEIVLLSRTGAPERALVLAREAIDAGIIDYDLVNAGFLLGWRSGDYALAEKSMRLRMLHWPASRAQGHVELGDMYLNAMQDGARALASYRQALASATASQRPGLLARIPANFQSQLGLTDSLPGAPNQTSVSNK